jgi:hypothetical protein
MVLGEDADMLHMQAQLTTLGGRSAVTDTYDRVRFDRHFVNPHIRTAHFNGAAILEAAVHPLCDDQLELGRSLLPDAVTDLENIQARMRQSFAEKRRVSSEP